MVLGVLILKHFRVVVSQGPITIPDAHKILYFWAKKKPQILAAKIVEFLKTLHLKMSL